MNRSESPKILVVDDEQSILDMLVLVLQKEGYQSVETAQSGHEAVERCMYGVPELVVLDVMLPDMDGYEVCRRIRQTSDVPILFLTAKSSDLDKLMGFGVGADDYISKPFNPLEVVARIKAILRRRQIRPEAVSHDAGIFDFGHFKLDEHSATLEVAGEYIACPAREFQLLLFMCKNPNRLFSREQLYEQVWGESGVGIDNTVMVHMRRLREKIEIDPSNPRFLATVRGLGYKLITDTRGEEPR
ncbi:response regulator transcription factor [Alicyclobacillus fodiniaquatilis]|uniref:Response regulator transcription factor n=1 Tax=Alicyclobacillus fodiniaquatilis TaxID=1661150 RepID=A0ABW4JQ41_9BACL